jgi:hypothetical protein
MGGNIKPIKPNEVLTLKAKTIPDAMFQAVNEMIAKNWNGSSATVRKDDLLERYFKITGKTNNRENRDKLYDGHALDFEDFYRKEGWDVHYSSPCYGDADFEPYFEFKVKGKR